MLPVKHSKMGRSLVTVIVLLSTVLALTMSLGCGSASTSNGGVGAPSEAGDGGGADPRIRSSEGSYTIDDLKTAGVKANKDYDVEDLPGADAAWRVIFNRLDYEVRFYPDHQTLLDDGIPYAEHVTGDDAVVIGDDVIWEEGAKDRRRCSRDADTPHSGCAYSPRYWDYVVVGNMILMCEGLESKQSIENCDDLLAELQ